MSKPTPEPREAFRSFTVRVPLSTYIAMGKLAREEGTNLNAKVKQLIALGMGKHISLNEALRKLVVETVADEEEKS